jgi:hypothetical protein
MLAEDLKVGVCVHVVPRDKDGVIVHIDERGYFVRLVEVEGLPPSGPFYSDEFTSTKTCFCE